MEDMKTLWQWIEEGRLIKREHEADMMLIRVDKSQAAELGVDVGAVLSRERIRVMMCDYT